jgi:CubicO group peptidase (beta-lactamase class C family)
MKRASAGSIVCGFAIAAAIIPVQCAGAADPLPRADPAAVGFSAAGLARIDRFFEAEIAASRIPGAVIAVARDGKLA